MSDLSLLEVSAMIEQLKRDYREHRYNRCHAAAVLMERMLKAMRPTEAERPVVLATENGLTSTGQHIADCERDKARMDWMEQNQQTIHFHIGYLGHHDVWMRDRGVYTAVPHETLREAIDAAMRQSATESKG